MTNVLINTSKFTPKYNSFVLFCVTRSIVAFVAFPFLLGFLKSFWNLALLTKNDWNVKTVNTVTMEQY